MTAAGAIAKNDTSRPPSIAQVPAVAPRLGFLGVGWIGRHRMEAIVAEGCTEVVAVADANAGLAAEAAALARGAAALTSLESLLERDLDGLVIATPSALHAVQARAALERGIAVFCQKPLSRTAVEAAGIVEAARRANRLLAVDFSYRETVAMRKVRDLVASGELGEIYAVDLVFHNAYGPDKAWFRDPALSGGGCVIDLGIHLVDLALWTLDFPRVANISSRLYAGGRVLGPTPAVVEDYALAQIDLENGATARLACSWNLAAGRHAIIEASFHGTRGGAAFRNVDGSFYDFVAERYGGTRRTVLAEPPDSWGGRAAVAWARQLGRNPAYNREAERAVEVATVLDAIYGR